MRRKPMGTYVKDHVMVWIDQQAKLCNLTRSKMIEKILCQAIIDSSPPVTEQ